MFDLAHIAAALGVAETPSDPTEAIVALLQPKAGPGTLPFGATRRNPEGYPDEATYLAAMRPKAVMRTQGSERNSHRRWAPYVGVVDAILEGEGRKWGNAAARRQHARHLAASLWYGVPNINLGA